MSIRSVITLASIREGAITDDEELKSMKITFFRVENFRNIKLVECSNPPDFMVICGGNGCGKSALLNALMTAKENAGPYGGFNADPRAVSADAETARIEIRLHFSDTERRWHKERFKEECPESDDIVIEIDRRGAATPRKRSSAAYNLLSWYSRTFQDSPGFFDYIDAHRFTPKKQLSTWDASSLSDVGFKQSLGAAGSSKFQFTKEYLASLVMHDAQEILASHRAGAPNFPDSLCEIRDFFNTFFAPMEFVDVRIDTSPFQYIIRTPRGEIDIDDLSGGEKEILNTFIRFHQLKPVDAVILFDEADAHLHPDLERRYLEVLRSLAKGNQVWITTHSPEMMIAAGSESLYTIVKQAQSEGQNQLVRVTGSEKLHEVLCEVMGSRGLVSFNQRIIFIEGEESSADRSIYEHFYPPGHYNVSFVPAGNSGTVRKTAERVNELLAANLGFQQYFSILDGDIERAIDPPAGGHLCKLPVYHVENFLLDERAILAATKATLAGQCPFTAEAEVAAELSNIILSDGHMKPFTKALLDARLAAMAKQAWDAVFHGASEGVAVLSRPTFSEVEAEARGMMQLALTDGTWKGKCKGREVIRGYCAIHGFKYEHFRNLVLNYIKEPPDPLRDIMERILQSP